MQRSRLLLVLACVAVVACAQGLTRREALVEQQAVQDRVSAWVQTMNNAQVDSLMLFYDHGPELTVLWADARRTEGWEETEQAIRDFFSSIQYMNFVVSEPRVEVLSETRAIAIFRHSTDIVGKDNRRRPVVAGQGVVLFAKDATDGLWKIHLSYIADSRPSAN